MKDCQVYDVAVRRSQCWESYKCFIQKMYYGSSTVKRSLGSCSCHGTSYLIHIATSALMFLHQRSVYKTGIEGRSYWKAVSMVYVSAKTSAEEMYQLPGQMQERAGAASEYVLLLDTKSWDMWFQLTVVLSQIRAILEADYEEYGNPMMNTNSREPPLRHTLIADPFQDLVDETIALPLSQVQGLAKDALTSEPSAISAGKRKRTWLDTYEALLSFVSFIPFVSELHIYMPNYVLLQDLLLYDLNYADNLWFIFKICYSTTFIMNDRKGNRVYY